MAIRSARVLALCAGYGGLEMGLAMECQHRVVPVCYVEREAAAVGVLAQAMAGKRLAQAPIWSDLRTFDARAWRGRVDIITAGYPCQPESLAGLCRGENDPRWVWSHIARIIDECQPALVFAENVDADMAASAGRAVQIGLFAEDMT